MTRGVLREIPDKAKLLFSYEPSTGHLYRSGQRVTCKNKYGYIHVNINGQKFLAHRIIWFLVTGESPATQIDHINLDKTDNRFANLRLATPSQNTANRGQFRNTGLPKGVRRGYGGKFTASISFERRTTYLGTFETAEDAGVAYAAAAERIHGEFARID